MAGITWFLYSYLSSYPLTEEEIIGGLYVVVSLGSDFLTLFTGDKESRSKLQKNPCTQHSINYFLCIDHFDLLDYIKCLLKLLLNPDYVKKAYSILERAFFCAKKEPPDTQPGGRMSF